MINGAALDRPRHRRGPRDRGRAQRRPPLHADGHLRLHRGLLQGEPGRAALRDRRRRRPRWRARSTSSACGAAASTPRPACRRRRPSASSTARGSPPERRWRGSARRSAKAPGGAASPSSSRAPSGASSARARRRSRTGADRAEGVLVSQVAEPRIRAGVVGRRPHGPVPHPRAHGALGRRAGRASRTSTFRRAERVAAATYGTRAFRDHRELAGPRRRGDGGRAHRAALRGGPRPARGGRPRPRREAHDADPRGGQGALPSRARSATACSTWATSSASTARSRSCGRSWSGRSSSSRAGSAPSRPACRSDSVVMDLMIHDIDIVLGLVDGEPRKITAVGSSVQLRAGRRRHRADRLRRGRHGHHHREPRHRGEDPHAGHHPARRLHRARLHGPGHPDPSARRPGVHGEPRSPSVTARRRSSSICFVHKDNPLKLEIRHLISAARAAQASGRVDLRRGGGPPLSRRRAGDRADDPRGPGRDRLAGGSSVERRLGLMAGAGILPGRAAAEARRQGWRVVAFAFDDAPGLADAADACIPSTVTDIAGVLTGPSARGGRARRSSWASFGKRRRVRRGATGRTRRAGRSRARALATTALGQMVPPRLLAGMGIEVLDQRPLPRPVARHRRARSTRAGARRRPSGTEIREGFAAGARARQSRRRPDGGAGPRRDGGGGGGRGHR